MISVRVSHHYFVQFLFRNRLNLSDEKRDMAQFDTIADWYGFNKMYAIQLRANFSIFIFIQ